jgi:hypothetical protein
MHEFGKENIELLNKAVDSVPEEIKVVLSHSKNLDKRKLKGINERVSFIAESEGDSFAELVNAAVDAVANDFKWFSILEFDDTYTPIWLTNVKKYMDFMPDTSVFMTLEDITDFNNGKYIGFGNAEAWASSFSNQIGYIDNDCLQNYFDFYLTGSIFNIKDWQEVGGLKPQIKLTFWYEWLLRLTNKGKTVFVIPKVGYNHNLNRSGSLVNLYRDSMSKEEIEWNFDLAKREYFYHPSVNRDQSKFEYKSDEEDNN